MRASEEAKPKGKVWTKIIACTSLDKMGSVIFVGAPDTTSTTSEIQGIFTPRPYTDVDLNIILGR